jgi:lysophospholipase L1-like esterase
VQVRGRLILAVAALLLAPPGVPLHGRNDGSQLSAALAFLHAHRGQVSPITINIGANDLNGLRALCGDEVSCYFANGPAVLETIEIN